MKIVIVEDQLILREALCRACAEQFHHEVVAAVDDGSRAIEAILRTRPDAVILDLELPVLDGFTVIETVRIAGCEARFVVLSGFLDPFTVYRVQQLHVSGFVDKNASGMERLGEALAVVAKGGVFFTEAFQKQAAERRKDPRAFDKLLTDREREILRLMGDLLTDQQIATALQMTPHRVSNLRVSIQSKLGLDSRIEVTQYARSRGIRRSVARPGSQ